MKKSFAILLLLALVSGNNLFSQAKPSVISGKVTSFEESLALEGVSVYVKDSKNNTGTQPDGTFSLEVAPGSKVLVFELKDYEKQEVNINGKKQYDIVLKRSGNSAKLNNRQSKALLASNTSSKAKQNAYQAYILK